MKKRYEKPEIFFENFSLSTCIANDCDAPFRGMAQFVCGIDSANGVPGMTIFTTGIDGGTCSVNGGGMDDTYDGFCYHFSASSGAMLFNS